MTRNHPDFAVIGAMKSASTSLADLLSQHPDIFITPIKEPGFFSRDERYNNGIEEYLSLYDGAGEKQLTGEASTCYSRSSAYPNAAERLHRHSPDCKLIYIMRNPVKRTYSHYAFRMAERLSAHPPEAVISYMEALKSIDEILDASNYIKQIRHYMNFFPSNQFHFIILEELISNEENEVKKLCDFLGINPRTEWSLSQANSKGTNIAKRKSKKITQSILERIPNNAKRLLPEGQKSALKLLIQKSVSTFIRKSSRKVAESSIPSATFSENKWVHSQLKTSIEYLETFLGKTIVSWKEYNQQFED